VLALAVVAQLIALGRRQRKGEAAGMSIMGGLVALAVLGAVALPRTIRAPSTEAPGILPTKPFSEAALAAARAQGKPVFVWLTADWCLTCKVNENLAIERADVRDAFTKAGVTVLKGDWTRRDPAITRYLTAQGAAGVPLYVWYPAGGGVPQTLPQVLTPGSLTSLK
jgi:thiol:disulfide interchange protein